MNKKTAVALVLALAVAAALVAPTSASALTKAKVMTDYLVYLKGTDYPPDAIRTLVADAGGVLVRDNSKIGLVVVRADSLNFVPLMSQNPAVRAVSEDIWIRPMQQVPVSAATVPGGFTGNTRTWDRGGDALRAAPLAPTPDSGDSLTVTNPTGAFFWTLFGWNYRIVEAPAAWALGQPYLGDPAVKVAVLDTGIDYLHLDTRTKVDLTLSTSFVPEDDALVAANFPGAHVVADLNFHGTMAAGTIACNARGTACLAPNVTLVGVKVVNKDYQSTVGRMASGIVYAADAGVDIINISYVFFPYLAQNTPAGKDAWKAIKAAINYAKDKGIMVFAEAGVDPNQPFHPGIDADHNGNEKILPAEGGGVVVSATSFEDHFSNFNNYGNSLVDISAPGGEFPFVAFNVTALWGPCSSFTLIPAIDFCRLDPPFWVSVAGTIGATAQVSALAALIKSIHPDWTADQVIERIYSTADDLGTPGKDAFFGRGRINAFRALSP